MDKAILKIPRHQLNEFLKDRTDLIKSRMKLAAFLLVFCILIGDAISMIALRESVAYQMKLTWLFSGLLCAGTFIFVNKIKSYRFARTSATVFMMAVIAIMSKDCIGQGMPPFNTAMIFIFIFFGFSLAFPWSANDILWIAFLHFSVYVMIVVHTPEYFYKGKTVIRELPDYLEGLVIMLLSLIVCYAFIQRERERDVENFILFKEVEEQKSQMQKELELATKVHSRLIPKSINSHLADIAVTYLPMSYMGGDYAKFYFLDKNKLIFIICDVTGHGVSAALLVNAINAEFERLVKETTDPGEILKNMNNFITEDFAGVGMYLSAFCGLLDHSHFARKFTYSNYGHPPQYLYHSAHAKIEKISAQTSLLGLPLKDDKVYHNTIPFEKEDQILLFTDGVIETRNSDGEQYGADRLESFIKKHNNLRTELFNKTLLDELKLFTDNRPEDDIFILNILTK